LAEGKTEKETEEGNCYSLLQKKKDKNNEEYQDSDHQFHHRRLCRGAQDRPQGWFQEPSGLLMGEDRGPPSRWPSRDPEDRVCPLLEGLGSVS